MQITSAILRGFLCALLVFCALVSEAAVNVHGVEEGVNAYTFFLLKTLDENRVLRDVFYAAGEEVSLRLFSQHFDVLADNHTMGSDSVGAPALEQHSNFFEVMPYYDIQLSDEWVVLEKPLHGAPSALLHCRLPLLLNESTVAARREEFIRENEAKMQQRLREFWTELPHSPAAGSCLYGEGDGVGKGTEEYYVLCPLGKILHVRWNVLASIITGDKSYVDGTHLPRGEKAKAAYMKKQASLSAKIRGVLKTMSQLSSRVEQSIATKPFRDAFEVIGEYSAAAAVPRWNRKREAWEFVFPSSAACQRPVRFSTSARRSDGEDEEAQTWTTTVTLRCAPSAIDEDYKTQPVGKSKESMVYWSWTEVRSLCAFRLELSCSAVCEWEHHMQNLRTTPIPCAVLN